jgi:hypothetical protein
MELNFETLRKIVSKETNNLLDDFNEYISCSCNDYGLMDICVAIDNYENSKWHELITSLSKDLKGYDVAMDDEDDLTREGYDFLILFIQNEIITNEWNEWVSAVAC